MPLGQADPRVRRYRCMRIRKALYFGDACSVIRQRRYHKKSMIFGKIRAADQPVAAKTKKGAKLDFTKLFEAKPTVTKGMDIFIREEDQLDLVRHDKVCQTPGIGCSDVKDPTLRQCCRQHGGDLPAKLKSRQFGLVGPDQELSSTRRRPWLIRRISTGEPPDACRCRGREQPPPPSPNQRLVDGRCRGRAGRPASQIRYRAHGTCSRGS